MSLQSTRDSVEPEASVVGEEVIQQVHLMEHAINGKCWKPVSGINDRDLLFL